jgi:uncharacterized membrane protein YgaE (UPF0421/DUF939 family)
VTENVTDSSTPSQTATSSQTITVKTASGGSGDTFLGLSNSVWLIIIGGFIGLVASLTLLTVRARAKLKRSKRTMS